jgi:hypothetical protein
MMKTPADKEGSDLPSKPKGGGAAGRLRQFQIERGLAPGLPFDEADDADKDAARPDDLPKKPKKSKKPKP